MKPGDWRVSSTGTELSRADEAAALVLWDLKTEVGYVSMPASRKVVVIQRLMVDWETGVYVCES